MIWPPMIGAYTLSSIVHVHVVRSVTNTEREYVKNIIQTHSVHFKNHSARSCYYKCLSRSVPVLCFATHRLRCKVRASR
uniref:Putative secreted protein n=1 Tax=Anopheles darlingi TaxID=43151 RepID=A0A2M4DMY1_ANODA